MKAITDFLLKNALTLALLLFGAGVAWAAQVSALEKKADKTELAAIMSELKEQRKLIEDVKDDNLLDHSAIKDLLCRRTPNDSWCR